MMNAMKDRLNRIARRANDERGVTTVEYAIMLFLISIAVAGFGAGMSDSVTGIFQQVITALS